jgi:hypothetical protein
VQVFVDLTRFAATATRAQLRDRVRELEDVGATGVSVSDHIFFTSGGRPRTHGVGHGAIRSPRSPRSPVCPTGWPCRPWS